MVTAGGLDDSGEHWKSSGTRFLLSVTALGALFRGKFLAALRKLYDENALDLGGACASLAKPRQFNRLMSQLYAMSWVVYSTPQGVPTGSAFGEQSDLKRPFGSADHVYQYLGQYTHRVGIANSRLLHVDEESVRFRTRGRKHVTVTPEQFIGRLLLHVLPARFTKVRHFGLLAPANVHTRLEAARRLVAVSEPIATPMQSPPPAPSPSAPMTWRERVIALTGVDPMQCPACRGKLLRSPIARRERTMPLADTS